MLWQSGRRSTNVENRRGMGAGAKAGGAGGMFLLAFVVYMLGGDPSQLVMQGIQRGLQPAGHASTLTPAQEQEQVDFVSSVLGSTEDVWAAQFAKNGQRYIEPKLVLFTGMANSACGTAQSAMGPFYCPNDQKVYLDLDFFEELSSKLNAPGDFARAYVIAHEVGHHIQNITGVLKNAPRNNAASVKVELQADCLAGVWAHDAQANYTMLEPGDIDEALNAATQIGDDKLQKRSQGYVVPDSFTHGSSAQRYQAFKQGFTYGRMQACGL